MEFGWINAAGGLIVVLILVPNIIYALQCPGGENKCRNAGMNLLEQVGRYGSMALMILPLGVWKFGFPNVAAMLVYFLGNGVLLITYWVFWALYFRKVTRLRALTLAVVPTGIFLLSGLTLHHWLLVTAAGMFGVGHIYVTEKKRNKGLILFLGNL